jgi:hypothetical protein
MIEKIEQVTVLANDVHVETSSTQASEAVTGTAITALHGRSFQSNGARAGHRADDDRAVVARASVAIAPSGILNPRNQSISGRREDAQGWSISGITGPAPVSRSQFRRMATIPRWEAYPTASTTIAWTCPVTRPDR